MPSSLVTSLRSYDYLKNTSLSVVVVSVLLLPVAYILYIRIRSSRAPPTVFYFIPWVGSAWDIGQDPDAFFARAMCALSHFSASYGTD
jgi:hypothetical protein